MTMNRTRRALNAIMMTVLMVSTVTISLPAWAVYPDKPVKLIVPFPPGGATDLLARLVAKYMGDLTKQTFIVENKAGAGGNVGMEQIALSAPDGYTLGMIITSHAINMSMPNKPNYDVKKNLSPIAILAMSNNILVVNPNVPVKTVAELIALGKQGKAPLNFGSAGNGTTPHLSGELFNQLANIQMKHVPYRGAGPAMVDLIGGNIELMFDAITTATLQIKAGNVRAIAVTGAKRSPVFPDIPTISEAGLPGYFIEGWMGVVAPEKTPPEVIEWLSKSMMQMMQTAEFKAKIIELGMVVGDMDAKNSKVFIAEEVDKWGKIISSIDAKND